MKSREGPRFARGPAVRPRRRGRSHWRVRGRPAIDGRPREHRAGRGPGYGILISFLVLADFYPSINT